MIMIILNNTYNTNATKHNNRIKYSKYIVNNKMGLQQRGTVPELKYIGVHSVGCVYEWRSVLEFRNWTALRTLILCNKAITQLIVKSTTMGLNSSAVCRGPIFIL